MKTISTSLIAILALGFVSSALAADHMDAALAHLQAAKAELQVAEANKGGWRMQAIKTIDDAIAQVKAGKIVGGKR
jgi:hypothetical protein